MNGVAKLLDRLSKVRQTGSGRWLTRCPAHEDRSPSLSIRELDDGRILLHCFAGCGAVDVVEAIGFGMEDLFPEGCRGEFKETSSRIPARDLLEIISEETSVVAIVAVDLLEKKTISEADWQRLAKAAARIGRARDHLRG